MPASKSGVWRNPRHGTSTGYCNYGCRCSECRAWNARQQQRWRDSNPEKSRAYARAYYRANPEKARRDKVLRRYGINLAEYDTLLIAQGGVCAICDVPPPDGVRLHVDHDHSCCEGQRSCGACVRGLLCSKCNSAIAFFDDDPGRIEKAISYLASQREYAPEGLRNVAD